MRLCSYSNPSELKRAKVGPSKNTNSHLFNLYKFPKDEDLQEFYIVEK